MFKANCRGAIWLYAALGPAVLCGCASDKLFTSKWAMDDAEYAEKYSVPYQEGEKIPRMAKQMVDARHVEGKTGIYVGGAVQDDPIALGGELGLFAYPTPWLEGRAAAAGLLGAGTDQAFLGLNTGLRVQPPTRIAPFAGLGTFIGSSQYEVVADGDGLDNDDDYFVDERGETETEHGFLASVYPEVGVHAWLSGRWRVTGSAAYHVTTLGRDHDFWLFGLYLSLLNE